MTVEAVKPAVKEGFCSMRHVPVSRADHLSAKSADRNIAIIQAAEREVVRALATEYRPDPIFRPEMSQAISVASALTKRHGRLIELAVAEALRQGGLTVLRNVMAPVTRQALDELESASTMARLPQPMDFDESSIVECVEVDVIAIEREAGWAGLLSLKRGGGQTESRKRREGARLLQALNLTLVSWLHTRGYETIKVGSVAIIDYYGQAGFPKEMTVTRENLDQFFGLPVVGYVEAMTKALFQAADTAMVALLQPVTMTRNRAQVNERDAAASTKTAVEGLLLSPYTLHDDTAVAEADCEAGLRIPRY